MPFTYLAFLLGSLSVIGLPPMGGSWSKWYLVLGAAEAEQRVMMLVLITSSLLSVGYLMPVVAKAFFGAPAANPGHGEPHAGDSGAGIREAPLLCVLPPVVTAVGCIVLFFFAQGMYDLLSGIGQ
jgi:multicomponent Na+:H+ antiporter subunit D